MAEKTFPNGFLWGSATASYQVEGAYNEGGKGENMWDKFTHRNDKRLNGINGDVASDHYHRYKEDVKLMAEMGHNSYRFSISWSRILPDGKGQINQGGIDFYNNLINELLEHHIEPNVTLYHWDLPQKLQDIGGWENREIIDAYVFVAALSCSSYAYVEAFLTMDTESWITGHINAFNHFDGVTRAVVPDNLKVGVTKPHRVDPVINKIYQEMAEYYGTVVLPARIRKPKDYLQNDIIFNFQKVS